MRSQKLHPKRWEATGISNLVKNATSGVYYYRATRHQRGKRKDFWRSLRTKEIENAKQIILSYKEEVAAKAPNTEEGIEPQLTRLYLITDGMATKIGVSSDPEGRLKAMQTGNANTLELLWFSGALPLCVEKAAHDLVTSKRITSEWFRLTAADRRQIIEQFGPGTSRSKEAI